VAIREIQAQRFTVVCSKSFEDVVAQIDAAIAHPDMKELLRARTYSDLEKAISDQVGPSGLMEFARFDLGAVLRLERGAEGPKILRLVVGNPLIMKRMVEHVPDAGSYAPVTILIDRREDGVHVSYDRMASLLAPYGNAVASAVARDLDAKVESLITAAAS
jgi:uncharacterized protein (DUF302 family)